MKVVMIQLRRTRQNTHEKNHSCVLSRHLSSTSPRQENNRIDVNDVGTVTWSERVKNTEMNGVLRLLVRIGTAEEKTEISSQDVFLGKVHGPICSWPRVIFFEKDVQPRSVSQTQVRVAR